MHWEDLDWAVETIFKAVVVFVRLREGVVAVFEAKKTRNRAHAVANGAYIRLQSMRGCPFNCARAGGR
jgi:radical SAM superfamily enzyme YgiQ (UPF0313 family)